MSTSSSRPTSRPAAWKAAAPAAPSGTKTFAAKLPKLPVPEFPDTLARLKQSLVPIAWSNEEYGAVSKKIDDFAAGQGPELHRRLLSRAAETRHWLEDWWDDGGYLGYRDSVVVNVSYYYGFDEQPSHLPQTPAARAAALARSAMMFRRNLKQGSITPDGTKEGPMCMDTYRWMFDCCRIPGPEGLDWSVSYAKENDTGDSGHIIVIRNNRVWKIVAAEGGRILSTEEFEKQIHYIYENSNGVYPGVGVLSASNRDVWAKDYGTLSFSTHNSTILSEIQSAAFVISLEACSPATPVQHSRALWHGSVIDGVPTGLRTRWVDKPVQFIVYDNAVAGLMGEHSVMDGTPTVRLCDDILDMLADPGFDHGSTTSPSTSLPKPFDWEITPAITEAITKADAAAVELIESQELGFLLTPYGKAAIKKFGVSPDSWAQMIVQLAYRRLIGDEKRIGGTYEAATTRRFDKGRTEAIRVVTSESDAWVASMDNPKVDNDERKRLFAAATKKHVELAKSAGNGLGVDRHLLGLKKLLKADEKVPELFTDPVFLRSSYWVLSTSAIFSKHFPVYGWGEVVPDGFGVAYMTGYEDRLQYTITSRKEMPNAKFSRRRTMSSRIAPSDVKNKAKREELARKSKKAKGQRKLERRLAQAKAEANDPAAKKKRLAENVPHTLDNMREFDPSILTADPNQAGPSSSPDTPDEAAEDIANDPFASYFAATDDPSIPPKILITTSPKASKSTYEFCDELVGVFPGAEFIRRKKGKGFEMGRIAGWAAGRDYKHLLVVNEDMKKPRYLSYAFRSTEKVALQEIGPRFTLKLRSLRKGIPAVVNYGEAPKPLEFDVSPFEDQETGTSPEDAADSNDPQPRKAVVPPKTDEYLWQWKASS
ncbi:hypothetical protein H0H92_000941 [Tricholoma furcatifolium]|nr:hypothetical protein H0H92_000941 [Tricholoma furcatifolium]